MRRNIFLFSFCVVLCVFVFADDEVSNQPVVRSSEDGAVYANSIPEESYGHKGKTQIFGVGKDRDTLICEYKWYAGEIYVGGSGDHTVVRLGPWQRGRKPEESHLALGLYREGKTLREYSALEMQKLGSGVSTSISHYTLFKRRLGFRWLQGNSYLYEVEGVSGKIFSFDLDTGQIISPIEKEGLSNDFLIALVKNLDVSSLAAGHPHKTLEAWLDENNKRNLNIEWVVANFGDHPTIAQLAPGFIISHPSKGKFSCSIWVGNDASGINPRVFKVETAMITKDLKDTPATLEALVDFLQKP